jgi:hypothetical protein
VLTGNMHATVWSPFVIGPLLRGDDRNELVPSGLRFVTTD